MTLDEKLDENFFDGTLEDAVRVLANSSADPIETSVLLEAVKRLQQSRRDIPRMMEDFEKLANGAEFMTWCEGCSAPLLTTDDWVAGEDCNGCWHTMAEGDWPEKPCYAYRVGKKSAVHAPETP